MPVAGKFELHEQIAERFIASGLFPKFDRLKGWHQHFDRSGPVHFFTYNGFGFTQTSKAEREIGVCSGAELADKAGSDQ